jgi:hypothetical protein
VLPFYLPFIFGYSLNSLLVGLLTEKEKKLKVRFEIFLEGPPQAGKWEFLSSEIFPTRA